MNEAETRAQRLLIIKDITVALCLVIVSTDFAFS